uniref:SH3 domain-containing protein n=1 Tax=Panagrolaimus sp. PS1159 TaxID=55785 RepID=A0AC35G7K5_9BILA
ARRQSNDSPSIAGQIKKASYEDKFADSYQRGQAELERRRQIAREEEERLRAESERREREERERRERERQEIERRREAEREAERQRELEREKARQEEEAKLLAEREAIRKKLEEERMKELEKIRIRELEVSKRWYKRMKELEKIRIRELENQKETESEKTAQIQQRLKNMTFQLQALQEKSDSLNNEVTKARDEIIAITSEIEGMRAQRDEKLALMSQMQQSHQQLSIQCERVSHEHLQLQSECRLSINRAEEIENLRKVIVEKNEEIAKVEEEIVSIREKVESQGTSATTNRPEFEKSNEEFAQLVEEYNEMARRAIARQEELRRKAAEKARASFMEKQASFPTSFPPQYETPLDAFDNNVISPIKTETSAFSASNIVPQVPYNNGFENSFTSSVVSTATSAAAGSVSSNSAATKYRALYEFVARTDDEITSFPTSFPPQYETPLDAFDNNVISPIKTETSAFSASNIVPPPSSNQVPYNNGFENSFTSSVVSTATSAAAATGSSNSAATKYRALYEFPGWLAGQIRGKVGWFPAAFAEPIIIGKKASIPSVVTSPSSEPLASIKEDPNERDIEPFAAFGKNVGPVGNYDTPPALSALSLYEQPPVEDTLASPPKETPSVTTTTTTLPAYDAPPGDVVTSVSTLSAYDTPPATDEKVLAIGTALYRWNAQKEGDLSFSKGDEIEILEQAEMKWRGRLYKDASIQGWFPKSYVKIIDKASSKQSPTVPTSPKSESNGASKEDGEWYIALWGFEAVE